MSRRLLSTLAVLAIAALPLPAAGFPRPEPAVARFSVEAPGSLFAWLRGLLGLQEKNGCRVDPNGRCIPEPTAKNGCHADPNGYCLTGATPGPVTENGCVVDPFGRCGG